MIEVKFGLFEIMDMMDLIVVRQTFLITNKEFHKKKKTKLTPIYRFYITNVPNARPIIAKTIPP